MDKFIETTIKFYKSKKIIKIFKIKRYTIYYIMDNLSSVEPVEIVNTNHMIEEYRKKYKTEELTADGIPTIETQLRELKEEDDKVNIIDDKKSLENYKREMTQRVKCICLKEMDLSPFTNTNNMSLVVKNKLQKLMWTYNEMDHLKIISIFNTEMSDILDDVKYTDMSKLPIYNY